MVVVVVVAVVLVVVVVVVVEYLLSNMNIVVDVIVPLGALCVRDCPHALCLVFYISKRPSTPEKLECPQRVYNFESSEALFSKIKGQKHNVFSALALPASTFTLELQV